MNTMKQITINIALLLLFAVQFIHAQDYILTSVAKQGATYLELSEKELTFGVTSASKEIKVTTNTSINIENEVEWCQAIPTDSGIKIDVEQNDNTNKRTTFITVIAKDGLTQIIEVTQLGTLPEIVASPSEITITDINEFEIEVASSVKPVFICSEWITLLDTISEIGTKTYKFTTSNLIETAQREGEITINGANNPVKIKIIQITEKYPSFAVISDLHFGNTKGEGPMVKVPRTLKNITSHKKLDAIFVVGDLADGGKPEQYKQLVSVFTDSTNYINPVTRTVFMLGNHDNYSNITNYAQGLKTFNNDNNYPFDQYIVIKGYPFICISNRSGANNDDTTPSNGEIAFPKEIQDTLSCWLERASKECPGKPIFVFTHIPPKYTCYSTWPGEGDNETWPTWSMRTLNPILNKYPQAIVFSGHSHYPLGDPRSIHQGVNPQSDKENYYTVINTASTTYSEIHSPSVDEGIHPKGYEHVTEGMIVDVLPTGNVEIRRYDTKRNEEIQPNNRWMLKAPFDGSQFCYADIRDIKDNIDAKQLRTGLPAPQFDSLATIVTTPQTASVTLSFPQATDNEVVFRYKVQIINEKGYAIKSSWIFSEFYNNSEMPDSLTATFTGLTNGATYYATVEAYDSYENTSKKLISNTFIPKASDNPEDQVPTRIGLWTFNTDNDTIINSEGSATLTPGNETTSGKITLQKTLSASGITYIEDPTDTNKAINIPKGSMFKISNNKRLASYTLMYDVRILNSGWHCLIQTNTANDDDGDIFINSSGNIGLNVTSLGYGGTCALNRWHRIVISVNNGNPTIYLDGNKVLTGTVTNSEQWVISKKGAYLFCDDNGEDNEIEIAEIALWDEPLSETQVSNLGIIANSDYINVNTTEINILDEEEFKIDISSNIEPTFSYPEWVHLLRPIPSIGSYTYIFAIDTIPVTTIKRTGDIIVSAPQGCDIEPIIISLTQKNITSEIPSPKGKWTFDTTDNLLENKADNSYIIQPGIMNNSNITLTDDIDTAGIIQVTGPTTENKAIILPKTTMLNLQYQIPSIEKVRNYTIMYDIRVNEVNDFNALLQTNMDNTDDTDFCINEKSQIGIFKNWGYGGKVYAGRWHRIVLSVKDGVPNAYLDGELVTPGSNSGDDIWCLSNTGCHLFCDNDNERQQTEIAEICYWDEPLSSMQVKSLGKIDYKYIYTNTPEIELNDNKNEFEIEVESSVVPKFEYPEWIKPINVTPAIGTVTYIFKADDMQEAGERNGTITISAAEDTIVSPVSITVKQTYDGGTLPLYTGNWKFDNQDSLYITTAGTAQLIPYKLADNGVITAYESNEEADISITTGPTADNNAIKINKNVCFKLQIDENENIGNYTIMYDIKVPDISNWRGLLQTALDNSEDADIFINKNGQIGLGGSDMGYGGNIETEKWYRITIVVRDGYANVYINGTLAKAATGLYGNRWFMDKSGCYLFCDNDGETNTIDVAEISFWNTALSETNILRLGSVE